MFFLDTICLKSNYVFMNPAESWKVTSANIKKEQISPEDETRYERWVMNLPRALELIKRTEALLRLADAVGKKDPNNELTKYLGKAVDEIVHHVDNAKRMDESLYGRFFPGTKENTVSQENDKAAYKIENIVRNVVRACAGLVWREQENFSRDSRYHRNILEDRKDVDRLNQTMNNLRIGIVQLGGMEVLRQYIPDIDELMAVERVSMLGYSGPLNPKFVEPLQ